MPNINKQVMIASLSLLLSGCAYVTALPTKGRPDIAGVRIYPPKAMVVVNGSSISSLVVPDCSKEYALRFGSFLAKNDTTIEIANGMLTKLDNKQDTTAFPIKLLDIVKDAAVAGKSLGEAFSAKVDGGTVDNVGIFELSCDNGALTANRLASLNLISAQTTAQASTPPIVVPPVNDDSIPIPKK